MKNQKIILQFIVILMIALIILMLVLLTMLYIQKNGLEEKDAGGAPYDRSRLKNIDIPIDIQGLTSEITNHIKNMDEFNIEFKEYRYLKGLVDADTAIVTDWNITENQLEIKMSLNDINYTKIKITINLLTDEIEITKDIEGE